MSAAWWWKRFSRGAGPLTFFTGVACEDHKKSSCFTQMDVVCEDIAELSPRSDNIWFYTEGDTLPCKRFGNYISNYLLEGALETLVQLHQGWRWKKNWSVTDWCCLSRWVWVTSSRSTSPTEDLYDFKVLIHGLVKLNENTRPGFERHEGCGPNHSFETAQTVQITKKQSLVCLKFQLTHDESRGLSNWRCVFWKSHHWKVLSKFQSDSVPSWRIKMFYWRSKAIFQPRICHL